MGASQEAGCQSFMTLCQRRDRDRCQSVKPFDLRLPLAGA
jgi:hypothetical protein